MYGVEVIARTLQRPIAHGEDPACTNILFVCHSIMRWLEISLAIALEFKFVMGMEGSIAHSTPVAETA